MSDIARFLRWISPLALAVLVMSAVLFGCRAVLVSADPLPFQSDYASQTVQLINQQRATHGLPALRYDSRLQDAADFHNRWMRDSGCFSHQCPGEADPTQRARNAGYPALSVGEIIGKGYTTPHHMVSGWMGSSGHRNAILTTYWVDIGCGYLRGPSGQDWDSYWSCELATSSEPSHPTVIIPPTRQAPPTPWYMPTPTQQAWPAPATPTPITRPPMATPVPFRSPTPPPPPSGRGYWLFLVIPVNMQTNALHAMARGEFCGQWRCTYTAPYSLVITIDADVASEDALRRAEVDYAQTYARLGVYARRQPK